MTLKSFKYVLAISTGLFLCSCAIPNSTSEETFKNYIKTETEKIVQEKVLIEKQKQVNQQEKTALLKLKEQLKAEATLLSQEKEKIKQEKIALSKLKKQLESEKQEQEKIALSPQIERNKENTEQMEKKIQITDELRKKLKQQLLNEGQYNAYTKEKSIEKCPSDQQWNDTVKKCVCNSGLPFNSNGACLKSWNEVKKISCQTGNYNIIANGWGMGISNTVSWADFYKMICKVCPENATCDGINISCKAGFKRTNSQCVSP